MTDFPFLTVMVVVPLLGAVATAALPGGHKVQLPKQVALGTSLLTLALGVVMAFGFDRNGGFQFTEEHTWITAFGAHYAMGVDGLGLLMVLLTAVLVPIVIAGSWYDADPGTTLRLDDEAAETRHTKAFFAWALALEALSIAVFAATEDFGGRTGLEARLQRAASELAALVVADGAYAVGGFGPDLSGRPRRTAGTAVAADVTPFAQLLRGHTGDRA